MSHATARDEAAVPLGRSTWTTQGIDLRVTCTLGSLGHADGRIGATTRTERSRRSKAGTLQDAIE